MSADVFLSTHTHTHTHTHRTYHRQQTERRIWSWTIPSYQSKRALASWSQPAAECVWTFTLKNVRHNRKRDGWKRDAPVTTCTIHGYQMFRKLLTENALIFPRNNAPPLTSLSLSPLLSLSSLSLALSLSSLSSLSLNTPHTHTHTHTRSLFSSQASTEKRRRKTGPFNDLNV